MKKEIVTIDKIKLDINNYCIYDLKRLWFPLIFTFVWATVLITLILLFPIFMAVKIVVIVLAVAILLVTVVWLLGKRRRYKEFISVAKSGRFNIMIDSVQDHILNNERSVTEKWFMLRGITRKTQKPYRLKFFNSGEYKVPLCENYTWSNDRKISGAGLYQLSQKEKSFIL